MIRINLASPRGMASVSQGALGDGAVVIVSEQVRKEALVKLLAILVIPIGLYFYEQQNIPSIYAELNQKQATLTQLAEFNLRAENAVQEIKKFKEDEKKIQSRISALEKLAKNRFREVKVLDLFQQVIPERLWFTRIEIKEGRILLAGMSMSDIDISTFMDSLSKSVFLQDVVLISSEEQSQEGMTVKKFEIGCVLESAGVQP